MHGSSVLLTLSNETVARLDAIQIDRDIRGIADWLFDTFEQWFLQIGSERHDVARSVRRIQQWSETRALRRNKDIRMLSLMSLSQGAFFYADPRFAGTFDRVARQFELDPDARLDRIYKAFEGWRRQVAGAEDWAEVAGRTAALMEDIALLKGPSPDEIVARVFPEQPKWSGQSGQKQFVSAVIKEGHKLDLPSRQHHACHMAMSTLFGFRWVTDPKLTRFTDPFLKESDPVVMSRGMAQRLTEGGI